MDGYEIMDLMDEYSYVNYRLYTFDLWLKHPKFPVANGVGDVNS